MEPSTRRALTPFLILFATLYAGFGVQSPYLPALLGDRGLRPEAIGMLLAAEVYVRTRGISKVACAKLHHENSQRCIFCGKPRSTN